MKGKRKPFKYDVMGDRGETMNLNILYKMIMAEKKYLCHAKELNLKFPGKVNPQAIEYSEKYIMRLIKDYKENGGKRNFDT